MNLQIREFAESELDYKNKLFAENKLTQLGAEHWSDDLKTQIVNMQFLAQQNHISIYFPNARDSIILYEKKRTGRIVYEISNNNFHLIDIIIEQKQQKKGIGSKVIKKFIQENKSLSLHVDFDNPALELYKKLGFKIIEQRNHQYYMEYIK